MSEEDLTAQEREALAALPREARPSSLLEDRTVRLLENRGLLSRRSGRVFLIGLPRAVAAAAATVVLILAGFWLGRYSNAPPTLGAVPSPERVEDLRRLAREVQRTGSEYILALEAFSRAREGDPRDLEQGREVAAVTLRAAADRVSGLAPQPSVGGGQRESPQQEQLIWF